MSPNSNNRYKSLKLAIPILRNVLQILGGTLALGVIILTFLVWRMSDGPVSLTFLRPHLEQLLNIESSGTQITFESLQASWQGWAPYVIFTGHNLSAKTTEGEVRAMAEAFSARLSVPALLRGNITFTKVDVAGLNLEIVRPVIKPDPKTNTKFPFNYYLEPALKHLSRTITGIAPELELPRIEEVNVTNSHLAVLDSSNLSIWEATSEKWYLAQSQKDMIIFIASTLNMGGGGGEVSVALKANYSGDDRIWETALSFSDFNPNKFQLVSENLGNFTDLNATISGSFVTSFQTISDINKIGFELFCSNGSAIFSDQSMFLGEHKVENLSMLGYFNNQNPSIFLESFEGKINGFKIDGSASLTNLYSNPHINAAFDTHEIPVDQLSTLWPRNLAKSTRSWVLDNISGGTIENITAYLDFSVNDLAKSNLERNQVFGTFQVNDTRVEYMNGLPPAENLFADGWFDGVDLHIDIESGKILEQEINATRLEFSDVYTGKEVGFLDLRSSGPLSDLVIFPGFSEKLTSWLGSKESQTLQGVSKTNLHIYFPLISDLTIRDLTTKGEVTFRQLALQTNEHVLGGRQLNIVGGIGRVFIDERKLTGDFRATVNEMPVAVEWATTPNNGSSGPIGNAVIRTTLTEKFSGGLEDLFLFADGEAALEITLNAFADDRQTALINIDAAELAASFPSINFNKKIGESVDITSHVNLDAWAISSPITFHFGGKDLKGAVSVELNETNDIAKISLQDISYRNEKITADILFKNDNIYEINLRTKFLDLGLSESRKEVPKLKFRKGHLSVDRLTTGEAATFSNTNIQYNALAKEGVDVLVDSKDLTISQPLINLLDDIQTKTNLADDGALNLSGKIENLYSSNGESLHNIQVEVSIQGNELSRARIEAYFNKQEKVRLEISGSGAEQKITIASENAGEFLKILGITSNLVGGQLYLVARYENSSDKNMLEGQCIIENFHVTNTPIIAQLLSMSLPTNVFELLTGKGVPFARLNAPFRYKNSSLQLLKARASGVSLGITVDGEVDLASNSADIRGTIIPAYLLNNLVGTVPVIGDILTGPEKEGIFAANYSAKGPINDLEIFVNPLTVLAPGILRDLFDLFSPDNTQSNE